MVQLLYVTMPTLFSDFHIYQYPRSLYGDMHISGHTLNHLSKWQVHTTNLGEHQITQHI